MVLCILSTQMYWVHIRAFRTFYKLSANVVSRTVGQNQFYYASIKRLTLSLVQSKFIYLADHLGSESCTVGQ